VFGSADDRLHAMAAGAVGHLEALRLTEAGVYPLANGIWACDRG